MLKQNTKIARGAVGMLQYAFAEAESETLTHSIRHVYLYHRSLQNSGNTPPYKLAAALCEISNQPMCG